MYNNTQNKFYALFLECAICFSCHLEFFSFQENNFYSVCVYRNKKINFTSVFDLIFLFCPFQANNFYCFFNNGAGNQMINVPSPANSSFVFTGSSAVRPVTAHMLRPSLPPGASDFASFSLT